LTAPLFRWFILRRVAQEPLRSLSTVIGLALGVAVVVAIQLTNGSSLRGFETALNTVSGRASLEIVGAAGGVDETRLGELGWLRDFGRVTPVIEGEIAVDDDRQGPETLRVLGIDILRDRSFRDYALTQTAQASDNDLLTRLLEPSAVILAEKFAAPRGLEVGSTLRVVAGDRTVTLTIRGLLKDEGPARVLEGHFALMDIAAAQWLLDRLGRIDRVEIRVDNPGALDAAEREIGSRLPSGLVVQRPSQRGRQVEQMLSAFHLNLTALSYIALVVGLFLVYNTISVAVLSRRDEIGMLRALGVRRAQVRTLFLSEAAMFAAAGSALGVLLGRVLADGAVALTATTVTTLYIRTAALPPALDWYTVALAFGIAVPLALIAAAVPAGEAARVSPVAAIRAAEDTDARRQPPLRHLAIAIVLLGAGVWLARRPALNGLPVFGYASAFAIIFGASFLVPAILFVTSRAIDAPVRRLFAVERWLAVTNIAAAIPRVSISVAALAVSLSMMVAIAIMVGSFRDTVIYWTTQTLQADLFISPASAGRPSVEATLSPAVIETVSQSADVLAVDRFRVLDVPFAGSSIRVGGGDFDVILQHGSLLFKAPAAAAARSAMRDAIGRDAVVASEAFTLRHGIDVGERVSLPTPAGPVTFRIAAVYFDYSNDRGVLMMDRGTFERHFGVLSPSGLTVYLKDGIEADQARRRLLGAIGSRHAVFINTNRSLRAEVLRIFDSTFAITYALEVVAIVVAILGISGTLVTLVLEREREFAILRLIGTTRRQMRRIIVGEAVLIGAVSQGIGLVVGLALSTVLIYVINVQSFGWTIQFHLPWAFLVQSSVFIVAATALAGLYPARRALRLTTAGGDHPLLSRDREA
jgi:putative ABC transport system permease protein